MFDLQPDIFMLLEHWLIPANLSKLVDSFPQYLCFGISAMRSRVESGVLYGRPFGGVAIISVNICKNIAILNYFRL